MLTFESINTTVVPTFEPLTVTEAREFCRIDDDSQDTTLATCIKAARERIETETRRAICTQTIRVTLDKFPRGDDDDRDDFAIILPRPPLQSVSSITYIDTTGTVQTLATDRYTVDSYSEPGRIVPAYGYSWPSTRDVPNAVTITFIAGYTAANLPARAKILCGLLTHYEFDVRVDGKADIPLAVESLMIQLGWGSYQ